MTSRSFIFIDDKAAEDIVSRRDLQSDDFIGAKQLAAILIGGAAQRQLSPTTFFLESRRGLFILDSRSSQDNFIVIDLEQARLFEGCSDRDSLLRLQKLLRFARRRWEKISPAPNERMIAGGTKAAVFPYPINTQSSIRISIDLTPDRQRRLKRSNGIEMLVYRIGTNEGGGPTEEAPVTNFRKALDDLGEAKQGLVDAAKNAANETLSKINALNVVKLQGGALHGGISGCNFDEWNEYLSESQKTFVEHALTSPERIEGPAGTGKTLCLVLKCIAQLRKARNSGAEHRALFVAHSESTKRLIQDMFAPELGTENDRAKDFFTLQSLKITTLHELCSELLRYEIGPAELLDRDAFESKQAQLLYTLEALQEVISDDLPTHRPRMSEQFCRFLDDTDIWTAADLFQHEISVVIKGRAGEDFTKYKKLPRLTYGLPVGNEGDKAFTFLVFNSYQRRLKSSGQFDTDDVVISSLYQLDNPIWRRRREREGYDGVYIDETHLFNINELSIFHKITRSASSFPIAYSADVSQSLSDRGWADESFDNVLTGSPEDSSIETKETRFSSIFRCSPDIVNLAFSVTSAGATLFTNFDDPLKAASSAFTDQEERLCEKPTYSLLTSDEEMTEQAFVRGERLVSELSTTRGDIAIIVFGTELFAEMERFVRNNNKRADVLKHRGDMEVVRKARSQGRFVLSTPDFVGGLEFDAVILVGVDKSRVPPKLNAHSADSENYVSYATHQRMYVALTRAKYRVEILGVKVHGASELFTNALASGSLEMR